MAGNWEGSTRGQRLPKGWATTRRRILERDGNQCTRILDNGTRCRARATDVDHIVPDSAGGSDDDTNLASLCAQHHATKSSSEGTAARWRHRAQRPSTKHPGLA